MFTESEIVPNGCDAGATFINIYHKYSHNYTHLMAFFQVSRHQKGRTIMDVKWSKRWRVALASAGPYANHLHLALDR